MMAQVPSPNPPDNKRVKVYELRNNDWYDSGTGFCTATYVFNEAIRSEEARVLVQSERDPEFTLLNTKVYKPEGFRKQSETLIIWNEPTTTLDMALSFQESDCCEKIWKFVNDVQQQLQISAGPHLSDDGLSDDITTDAFSSPLTVALPSPSLGSLQDIELQMRALHNTDQGRDSLTKYVLAEEYIQKLIPLVEMAEDMEDLASLHRLCNIMKTLILLNDSAVMELVVSDDVVLGVVGALEYDPDFPSHKANHRHWLAKEGRYKEVVRIDDEIRKKIHSTHRLQYLKDVVLARILDDPTFSILNSLIFFNQVDIVQHLQANPMFLKELFGIFRATETDQERKKDAVLFIQQCCAIAKNLQPTTRQQLYDNFLAHGLLSVINFALRHSDAGVRVGATDVLVSMIDHDPQMIRQTIFRQMSEKQTPLTDSLIDLLLVESDLGVKAQIADAIKVLLDPGSNGSSETSSKSNGESSGRTRQPDPQQAEFVREFYDESAKKLFKPLVDLNGREDLSFSIQQISLFIYLIEILCFFVRQHTHHSKYFVLSEKLGHRIAQLLKSSEKYLRLSAVKFFRNLVGLQDEFYNQQMIQGKLFEPILDLILETMPRDTLLNSAALELFNFIGREKINSLTSHLVENHRDKLAKVTYVDTFSYLITRYDSTRGFTIILEDPEDEASKRPRLGRGGRWESGLKDLDAQEEEYFNASDDEEEEPKEITPSQDLPTIASSPTKPLVDYLSDEEDDATDSYESSKISGVVDENTPPHTVGPPKTPETRHPIVPTGSPLITLEKISEKRRREADEVDELDRLSQASKRRSSSVGSNGLLRRRQIFPNSSGIHSPKTKIAISISPAIKKNVERFEIPNESEKSPVLETSITIDEQISNQ